MGEGVGGRRGWRVWVEGVGGGCGWGGVGEDVYIYGCKEYSWTRH